jgi:hypothetical protein
MWELEPSHCVCLKYHLHDEERRHLNHWSVSHSLEQGDCRSGCHLRLLVPLHSRLNLSIASWKAAHPQMQAGEPDAMPGERSSGCCHWQAVPVCGPERELRGG